MVQLPISYGHQYISDEDINAVVNVLKGDYLTCGPAIPEFEKAFAEYVHAKYAVAVSNATCALHLAANALGVKPGDNVICTPLTFASSANCIRFCGGNVKFVDIDPKTYLLDINKLRETLEASPKGTYKGMMLVDFAGYPFKMDEYRKLADKYGMWIIEDACHAPGAYYTDANGKKQFTGNCTYADVAVFSFHPVKHITTGEGGMVVTNREDIFKFASLFRTHGITHETSEMEKVDGPWYYEMLELGWNYRITDFQAALGTSQLKRARHNVELRRELVKRYNEAFKDISSIKTPYEAEDVYHAYHLYIIQFDDRKGLYTFLRENKIFAQVLYYPLNLMPYYKQFGNKKGDLPVVEDYYAHCLALPMFPTLTYEQQDYIIEKVKEFICK
ncbi:UDP-4-amino-4,6-dideoxy-N-acetyl-beta-L-altrosamine transaminase [Bacteroides uniformis]|mgnify:FL=1|jgi:UDP-4-amino-4,6-dideoxy-N-acetyl-beta-L-altrosamine transaminase|uniref:UDP-4-amino-4, 6-dideoxy-N-acetyl-beta-L-altrosamine transaminase n=1 Tax=Bacteroides uniformis TaxID=820 RepID=UPI000E57DD37|nr:UDP-4-amino-4,6-dideoxy-N-acetyl-beta-L-altrosamine transaminase [Bacteroides uniformis]RHD63699.1 UDP-4-amino-4,6-dideoxy-N-acetyl-beta-L-altrosamine transaminase [Bacteroides uniformis]